MQSKFLNRKIQNSTENPAFVLAIGFLILITIGGLILSTPFVTQSGHRTGIIDSFFIAASASCVTGLSPVNTVEHWNFMGQLVIILLIQIGGLGIMTIASLIPLLLRKKIGIRSRIILKEQLNAESTEGMIRLFRYVLAFTLIVESIGAILLSFRFIPSYGMKTGIWYSIFHSISAFCNAGFDTLGDSLYPLRSDYLVNITIMALIVIGGLGFMVTSELYYKRSLKNLSTHTKLVLMTTIFLIVIGALAFFIIESGDGGVLKKESLGAGILESFFQSVSARTAGFYSVELGKIKESTALVLIILMFIGGSPGSTAGGVKTTTFAILFLATASVIKNEKEPVIFKRRISDQSIKKALSIVFISIFIVLIVSFFISLIDGFNFIDILYETVSALATVGATRGITPELSKVAKILIGFCMYLGRIGPMTMAFAFGLKTDEKLIRYPESFISIG